MYVRFETSLFHLTKIATVCTISVIIRDLTTVISKYVILDADNRLPYDAIIVITLQKRLIRLPLPASGGGR